jgi:transposase InsO family protein
MPSAQGRAPLRRYDRQRSRWADLPQSGEGCHPDQPESALGVRHHLCGLPGRFVYVAIILDAWSRMIVGYVIGRSIDARLTVAAFKAAIARREPPPGCIHHSDRGSQYAAERTARRCRPES